MDILASDGTIKVCRCDEKTPLLWTLKFEGCEYWCPRCGYKEGMFGAGIDVPSTPELTQSKEDWYRKAFSYLSGETDEWKYDGFDTSKSTNMDMIIDHTHVTTTIKHIKGIVNIIFVGMHNKPGLGPLDSSTKSGKIVDAIINGLPFVFKCIKTNMCDTEYQPTDHDEIIEHIKVWHERYKPQDNDIVVLLGKWVQQYFSPTVPNAIHLNHPATYMGGGSILIYVEKAVNLITVAHCHKVVENINNGAV